MIGSLKLFAASAADTIKNSASSACGNVCGTANISDIFGFVANALIFLVGAISVIMIIIGGLRYVTSNGDAKATASAKDTILYAVVGIVVSIAAFAIVTFVTTNFGNAPKKAELPVYTAYGNVDTKLNYNNYIKES